MNLAKVFCLEESVWDDEDSLGSTGSVLPVLETIAGRLPIEFVHRNVATRGEFDHYLKERRKPPTRSFGLIYLAFHGSPLGLQVYDPNFDYPANLRSAKNRELMKQHSVSLPQLAEQLGKVPGAVVQLSSCSVFDTPGATARQAADRFLESTNARAICGYRRDVGWIESAALDLILISYLAEYRQPGRAFALFRKRHAGLINFLKWRVYE